MHPIEHDIIELLSRRKKGSLTRREIAERLRLRGGERKQLTRMLDRLVNSGALQERRGSYRLNPAQKKTVEGVFSITEQGYGFLRPDDSRQEDLFIPARHVGNAMDADRVRVSCHLSPRNRRPYAQVLNVLERAHQKLIGFYRPAGKNGQVWPLDKKLGGPVLVGCQTQVRPGDVVEVAIEQYAMGDSLARGRIVEVLGAADNPQVDIETVIRSYELPHAFSTEALGEAASVAQTVDPAEIGRRVDLRDLALVTIDGETARDFDDAVALKKQPDGTYRLWVCIADVAQYVVPHTALDREAVERGTSVYFPGFCLPMLPEALSNGICSLNPGQDRLVMAAELCFDQKGARLKADFYPAVMRSRARLTYTRVAASLDFPGQSDLDDDLLSMLREMVQLAQVLGEMRRMRGSLDLDLPEVEVRVDETGAPFDLVKAERNQAHRLIEEFMLAANEAVADYLTRHGWGLLYRIHEPPEREKLFELQQLAAQCGVGLMLGKNLQKNLQNLLAEIADHPEARLVNQQLLRSLKQARYSPHNSGHFGLAAECYCHFTSPIRRYPDLLVHRVLKLALAGQPTSAGFSEKRLLQLGEDCSAKERRAMQAERDLVELRRCQVMQGYTGEEFEGTISSVTEFGFFVELDRFYVEGLVHVRHLLADYYHFDPTTMTLTGERRRDSFRVGLRVRVRVLKVELWRRRIDFSLIETIANDGSSGTKH